MQLDGYVGSMESTPLWIMSSVCELWRMTRGKRLSELVVRAISRVSHEYRVSTALSVRREANVDRESVVWSVLVVDFVNV